jgi:hypothetical protein
MFFVDPSKLQKDFKAREAGFDSFAGDASFCFLQKVSICFPLQLQLNSKLPFICSKVLFQKVFSLLSFCFSFNEFKTFDLAKCFLSKKPLLFAFLLRFQSNSNLPENKRNWIRFVADQIRTS